jgi:DNA (cytosine-5)-methyltransferase 1
MFVDQSDTVLDMMMNCWLLSSRYKVLNAAQLGVPQARQSDYLRWRDVKTLRRSNSTFNLRSLKPLNYVYSIRDAIPWISRVADGRDSWLDADTNPAPTILASDGGRSSSSFDQGLGYVEAETDITKYCTGREWDNLRPGEQSEKYFQLVKADPELPCPTICASHGSGGIASVVHPFEKRKWSIAELKRICGFPDDFILTGKFEKQWERLGRAVPPVMMKHIASNVRANILNRIPR